MSFGLKFWSQKCRRQSEQFSNGKAKMAGAQQARVAQSQVTELQAAQSQAAQSRVAQSTSIPRIARKSKPLPLIHLIID